MSLAEVSWSSSTFVFAIISHLSIPIIPKFIAVESKLNDIMAVECVPDVQLLRSQKIQAHWALLCPEARQLALPAVPSWLPAGGSLSYSQWESDRSAGWRYTEEAWSSTGSDQAEGWGPAGSFHLVKDLPVNTASSGRTKSSQSAHDFEYFN